jgi:hypothetical protein
MVAPIKCTINVPLRCIAQTIQEVYSKEDPGLGQLCVLVDASTQKIAMKKWLIAELKLSEDAEPCVISRNLVHWEEVNKKTLGLPKVCVEGVLKVHSQNGFLPAYFRLEYEALTIFPGVSYIPFLFQKGQHPFSSY